MILEDIRYMRENRTSLIDAPIDPTITDRLYQQEAIRRVCEAFEVKKKRKALLVMATGTGKTRTATSTCDVFLKSNQARKVLCMDGRLRFCGQCGIFGRSLCEDGRFLFQAVTI